MSTAPRTRRERECPDCEVMFSGRRCPRCGLAPEAQGEPQGEAPAEELCSWSGREGCVFLATIFPVAMRDYKTGKNLRPGYCGWHYETLQSPRLGQEYDEFERFVLYRRAHYCTQFSHHEVRYLWDTIQGLRRGSAFHERDVSQPCRQNDCWVWGVLEDSRLASFYVAPEFKEGRRSVMMLVHKILMHQKER